ncbi:MAG TPA: phage/plasmid primase, P4 family [Bacteriovoracaceae bacterium]|nr:phage/plasmid primase, P4 family [Bacteriovoracaceae bacterium]
MDDETKMPQGRNPAASNGAKNYNGHVDSIMNGSGLQDPKPSNSHDDDCPDDEFWEAINSSTVRPQPLPPEPTQAEQAAQALLTQGAHDEGNAQCLRLRYAGLFVQNAAFGWMHYNGTHWIQAGAEAALDRAIVETLLARGMAALQSGKADQYKDLIFKSMPSAGRVSGAKQLFSSLAYAPADAFDADPDRLNCKNGVVDLRTGELHPHSPEQRFTYCAAVDYNPATPNTVWVNWLQEAVGKEAADWLQMAAGYSATGHTQEEVLFYLYGPPRSGKGTFTETMLAMLGAPVAKEVNFATFTAQRTGDSQNFDLAPLKACRLVAASESNAYERFNEAKIKALTGGNEVYCAFKHKDMFGYKPAFKIWLSTNQPVNADPDDDAVWGRLRVIEFPDSHLGKEDKRLKSRMKSPAVLEGVLAWIIEGARRWYALGEAGLSELESSKRIKDAHRGTLDNVQAWLDEFCVADPSKFGANSALYLSYENFCKDNGIEPKKQKGFSQSLIRKGFQVDSVKKDGKTLRGFIGISTS